jgi:hypothetical protein
MDFPPHLICRDGTGGFAGVPERAGFARKLKVSRFRHFLGGKIARALGGISQ